MHRVCIVNDIRAVTMPVSWRIFEKRMHDIIGKAHLPQRRKRIAEYVGVMHMIR